MKMGPATMISNSTDAEEFDVLPDELATKALNFSDKERDILPTKLPKKTVVNKTNSKNKKKSKTVKPTQPVASTSRDITGRQQY